MYISIYLFHQQIEWLPFLVFLTFAAPPIFSVESFRFNGVFLALFMLPICAKLRRALFDRFVAINVCKSGFVVGEFSDMFFDEESSLSENRLTACYIFVIQKTQNIVIFIHS